MGKFTGKGHCLTCPIRPASLFGCLKESELPLIEHFQTRVVTFEPGEVIYNEGERLGLIYTLREGHIKLTKFNNEGNAQIVRLIRPGDLFGIEKLINDSSYHHTAEALEQVEICQLSVDKLNDLREQSGNINQAIIERALLQVMKTENHLTQVGLLKSDARLAWFLMQWVGDKSDPVSFPISRRDLAQYLGLTVETISRHTAQWKRSGVISESKNMLTINDRQALESISTK